MLYFHERHHKLNLLYLNVTFSYLTIFNYTKKTLRCFMSSIVFISQWIFERNKIYLAEKQKKKSIILKFLIRCFFFLSSLSFFLIIKKPNSLNLVFISIKFRKKIFTIWSKMSFFFANLWIARFSCRSLGIRDTRPPCRNWAPQMCSDTLSGIHASTKEAPPVWFEPRCSSHSRTLSIDWTPDLWSTLPSDLLNSSSLNQNFV